MRASTAVRWAAQDPYAQRNLPGPLSPITFPTTLLRTKALIALGADPSADPVTWLWEDISTYIRYRDGISTSTGRADWSSTVKQGEARLRLDNSDGQFTRRNPNSPYYGLLSRNTPIWLSVDPGDGDHTRFQGFVAEWPTRWDKTGRDSTVPIVCGGPLRRLGRGGVLKSALYRAINSTAPDLYWPLEDGFGATRAASGITGGTSLRSVVSGGFGFTPTAGGSAGAFDLTSGAALSASVPGIGFTNAFRAEWVSRFTGATGGATDVYQWTIRCDGDYSHFHFRVQNDRVFIAVWYASGGALLYQEIVNVYDETWHHYRFDARQNGGTLNLDFSIDGVSVVSGDDPTGGTLGKPTNVSVNDQLVTAAAYAGAIAHIAIWAPIPTTTVDTPSATSGYSGEQAHVRMARVCAEEGVQFTTVASTSAALGSQPAGTLLDVLRNAEKAEIGRASCRERL